MKERNAIERIWQHIYTTGVSDTLMGLDLVSPFFILKFLEERTISLGSQDTTFADIQAEACHWSMIKQMASVDPYECCHHLRTNVSAWLRSLDPESCLSDAVQAFIQVQPNIIYRLMDAIDTLCEEYLSIQEAFEAVLVWAEKEGAFQPKAGQIMTPMHIAYLMADLVRPQADERVMDASCGTGNLLVAARQHMLCFSSTAVWFLDNGRILFDEFGQPLASSSLYGFDFNSMLLLPGSAHLLLSGVDTPHVRESDALGSVFNQHIREQTWGAIDVVLGNPPFSGFIDVPDLGQTLRQIGTTKTELLFIELTMQILREGGRACLLVPEGVVRNSSPDAIALRKKLVQDHRLLSVISLPRGIFLPQSNIKTSLLLLSKGGHTGEDVFFYRVESDGYSFDARREAIPTTNDLWDLRLQYAVARGLPVPVPGLIDADLWEQCASDKRYSGSLYFIPQVKEDHIHPDTGDRVQPFWRITGFTTQTSTVERSWFVSLEEIEASGTYSLCADTYRESTR